MTHRPGDVDDLIAALREDLPELEDERRVRARLTAAGIAVGGSAAAAGGSTSAAAADAAGSVTAMAGSGTAVAGGGGIAMSAAAQATGWGVAAAKLAGSTKVLVAVGVVVAGAAYPVTSSLLAPSAPATPPVTLQAKAPVETKPRALAKPEGTVIAAAPAASRDAVPSRKSGDVEEGRGQRTTPVGALPRSASRATSTVTPSARVANGDTTPTADAASLEIETALIERALAALRKGDEDSARRWLAEHERRFPDGVLVLERKRALARLH